MLKQRIITSLILAPLIGWGVYSLPQNIFTYIMAAVIAIGCWEWTKICHFQSISVRISYLIGVILVSLVVINFSADPNVLYISLLLINLWWIGVLFKLFQYRTIKLQTTFNNLNSTFAGFLTLSGCLITFVILRERYSPHYVMALMFLVWGADTFAYFFGKNFGKNKLLPEISPGKTIEGMLGGFLGALIIGAIAGMLIGITGINLFYFIIICLVTALFSIVGDLHESLYKRKAQIKDSGSILPGHGGMMDRIDSLTSAAPIYLSGLILLKG